ncbi:MAG: hypothetical protein LBD05_01790 [Mycoplasmataceae bacterium]|nr:hypothetical protein [Mycoplasmataceae bacterium]
MNIEFSPLQFLILIIVFVAVCLISTVLSAVVIINYYRAIRRSPKEVVEISRDGFVYKLATGEVVSVYKMKKRILHGYIFWVGTKDNVLRYDDIKGKVSNALEFEDGAFNPDPYWKTLKFKVNNTHA